MDKAFRLYAPHPTPHTPHPTPCPHEKLFQQTLSRCVKANRATAAFRYC
ncbi:hypothetical protein [Microcystis sp. M169S2]|nr:hypothetical protein [Microcystis sp. M169S2]